MDTTTKMFYAATMDKVYLDFLSVLIDVRRKEINADTVSLAKKIESDFVDLFDANNWLKIVAGTNVENNDAEWKTFLSDEVHKEFLDFESEK